MTQLRIGQIGLGLMGQPLARRLAGEPSFALTVCDIDPARFAGLDCASTTDLAALRGCDIILTCLPSLEIVAEVYLGPRGLVASGVAAAAQATIDTSTVAPELAIELSARLGAIGTPHIEAPLIGSPAAAGAGELFIPFSWAGADDELPPEVARVLARLSRARRAVGGPGTASLTKIMQNGLGLIQVAAIAEAVATCRRVGIDPAIFADVVTTARGMAGRVLIGDMTALMTAPRGPLTADIAIAAKDAGLYGALLAGPAGPGHASARLFADAAQRLGAVDYSRIIEIFDGRSGGVDTAGPNTHE